jgi:dTDP-4-dehydrorhamnose reductase/UDP-glucose 4-epimerase
VAVRADGILVVGHNSLLARAFLEHGGVPVRRAVAHGEIDRPDLLDGIGCAVNFALDPAFRRDPWSPDIDADLRLAERIAGRGIHQVLLSSRMVYAPSDPARAGRPLSESDPAAPANVYGRNKLATEQALGALLGADLTVLRVANVIGWERQVGRTSFMTAMLHTLATDGRITLDVSPFVVRDFLPFENFARCLGAVAGTRPPGVFNLGSGVGVPVGRIALWLMEGYGSGELRVTSPVERDDFVLDIARMRALCPPGVTEASLADYCRKLGNRLRWHKT